jgi:hypothetical protein
MPTAEYLNIVRVTEHLRTKAGNLLLAPLALMGFPFLPTPLVAAVGLAAGAMYVYYQHASIALNDVKQIDPNHRYTPPNDAEIVPSLYLGHALEFTDFEDDFERWKGENGITKVDAKARKLHIASLFANNSFQPFFMPHQALVRHVSITGGSGSGKTELYLSAIYQIMQQSGGAMIFDAKGSGNLIAQVNALAQITGRASDIMFVTMDRLISHTYNPLLYGSSRQTISTVMKMEGKTKEEFFRNLNRWALTAAILCLQAQPNTPAFNFADLGVIFNDPYEFHQLFMRIPTSEDAVRGFVWQFLKQWVKEDRDQGTIYDVNRYRERLTGLANNMFSLTHSEYGRVINDYSPDIELKSAILENKIIVISMGALSDKEGLELFGKLYMADLARAIGQIQAERSAPLTPYVVFLDEYASFADESHVELTQLARDANISIWISVQGKGFLDKVDPTFTARMLTNCATHIYFDTRDPDTREFAAKLAGSVVRTFAQDSESETFASSSRNFESGQLTTDNESAGSSFGWKEAREELLQPEHFAVLEPGDALVLSKYGAYRMRLPMMEFVSPPADVDEIMLPYAEKPKRAGLDLLRHVIIKDKPLIDKLSRQ